MIKPMTRNLLASVGADAGNRLLGFFATAYLARVMGPSSFGIISVGTSILSYCATLAGPGLNILGTRTVASSRDASAEFSANIIGIRGVLAGACALVAVVATMPLYGWSASWGTVAVFAVTAVPLAITPDWFIQAKGKLVLLGTGRVLLSVSYLLLLLLLVHGPGDIMQTAVAYFTGTCLMSGLLLVPFRRMTGPMLAALNPRTWWRLLHDGLPLGISQILMQTITNLPVIIVAALLTATETGLFGAAMKLMFFVLMIDRVFSLLFLPVASRAFAAGQQRLREVTLLGLKLVLIIVIPVVLAGIAYSGWVVQFVFGEGFAATGPILVWLMPYVGVTIVNSVMMTVLFAAHKERDFLAALLPATFLLLVLCVLLTFFRGAAGAGAGLSAGELVLAGLLIRKVLGVVHIPFLRVLLPFAGGSAGMIAVMALPVALHPMAGAALGSAVFIGVTLLFRGFTRSDLATLREKMA